MPISISTIVFGLAILLGLVILVAILKKFGKKILGFVCVLLVLAIAVYLVFGFKLFNISNLGDIFGNIFGASKDPQTSNGEPNNGPSDNADGDNHVHVFENKDAWEHVYVCDCKENGVSEPHSGGEATCRTHPVCSVCGVSYGRLAECQYEYGFCVWCGEAEYIDENLVFELSESGDSYILTRGRETTSSTVRIPSYYNGLPVTEIATAAFYERRHMTSVYIPDTVRIIRNNAFDGCFELCYVRFAKDSSLEVIEDAAFNTTAIRELNIPKSVIEIGRCAFGGIDATEVTFEEGSRLQRIGQSVFYCSDLLYITIPESVTAIGIDAFSFAFRAEDEVLEMHYAGTIDQWNQIKFFDDWNNEISISEWSKKVAFDTVHCIDGDVMIKEG